jgi:hypothetical protein
MGMGLAISLIAVGSASIFWAATHMWSVTTASATGRGYAEFAPTRAQNARSTESDDAAADDIAHLLAALERVTEERDKARQELMELEDRWSW